MLRPSTRGRSQHVSPHWGELGSFGGQSHACACGHASVTAVEQRSHRDAKAVNCVLKGADIRTCACRR